MQHMHTYALIKMAERIFMDFHLPVRSPSLLWPRPLDGSKNEEAEEAIEAPASLKHAETLNMQREQQTLGMLLKHYT